MSKEINSKCIKLAEIRYFDREANGIEYTPAVGYVVLLNRGDTYINLLNLGDICPIFDRVSDTTNQYDGKEYVGTKISHVFGELRSGEAWVLLDCDFSKLFGSVTSLEDVEDYVLRSNNFFKDRIELAKNRLSKFKSPLRMKKIIMQDEESHAAMRKFFDERNMHKVYKI